MNMSLEVDGSYCSVTALYRCLQKANWVNYWAESLSHH